MTREKAEELIESAMREAWRVYKTYNPNGQYLAMTISRGGIMVNNEHWGRDKAKPVDFLRPLKQEAGQ